MIFLFFLFNYIYLLSNPLDFFLDSYIEIFPSNNQDYIIGFDMKNMSKKNFFLKPESNSDDEDVIKFRNTNSTFYLRKNGSNYFLMMDDEYLSMSKNKANLSKKKFEVELRLRKYGFQILNNDKCLEWKKSEIRVKKCEKSNLRQYFDFRKDSSITNCNNNYSSPFINKIIKGVNPKKEVKDKNFETEILKKYPEIKKKEKIKSLLKNLHRNKKWNYGISGFSWPTGWC